MRVEEKHEKKMAGKGSIVRYPSNMAPMYRDDSHLGKAFMAALEAVVSSSNAETKLTHEQAYEVLQAFDKAVVKVIRTVAPETPLIFEAANLAGYRILPNRQMYVMQDVAVYRCVKSIKVQWWLRDMRLLYGPGFGEPKNRNPEKLPKADVERRKKALRSNYTKIHVANVESLMIIADNPFKGGEVKVQAGKGKVNVKEGISREGVKKDEFGDKYTYVQVRDNLDPYYEYTYRKKVPKEISQDEQQELEKAEELRQARDQNIPHRFKNSKTYKKFLQDEEVLKTPVTFAKPSTSKKCISTSGSKPQYKTSPAKGRRSEKR